MGITPSKPLTRAAVPAGKIRLCVSGFGISHHTGRARKIADTIAATYPEKYETWYYFDTFGFRPDFLNATKGTLSTEQQEQFSTHNTSPFVWLEKPNEEKPFAIGGRDNFCEWVKANFKEDEKEILELCQGEPSMKEIFFDNKTPGTASSSA